VEKKLSASTVNVRLSAIRKLVGEAQRNGILDAEQAAKMTSSGKLLHHLLAGKQILYLGEETVHVQGTAGLVEESEAP
jgi:hypothetical protein